MITEDSLDFLRKTPPFQFLDETALQTIAGSLSIEFFPKNSLILTQDGPPADSLRVIKKGGVKIYLSNDDEIVIDFKGEGDSFGYVSLISGDRSRANVLTVEDTICYLIPKDTILQIINTEPLFGEYYMKSFFKNYLDKTYREMRNKNLLFKEGEKILYTAPVKDILSKSAVTTPIETPIKDAAGIMSLHNISSLVLINKHDMPVGIITDSDLRERVVAKSIDLLVPVKEIMSTDLVTVDSRTSCFDALSTMIRHNIHHLLVTEGSVLKGVVTNHDFMLLQGTSPLSVMKNINRQKNTGDLAKIHKSINQTISILLKEGVKASYILRIITELHDRLINKFIELSMKEIGSSHCPFAFFVYGSEGRKEETFKTVFRCAIVYSDSKTYCEKKDMEEFCERLIDHLQTTFGKCGLPLFDTEPLGKDVSIYGDITEWKQKILHGLRFGERKYVLTARKILDSRAIYGNESVVESLKDQLYKELREDGKYGPVLFEHESRQKSPVGFFRRFVVDEKGDQQEKLDIKEKAVLQIVDSIRMLAIAENIHETSTIERLELLARRGLISNELRNDVYSAIEFLLHLLMQAQLMKKESNLEIDNIIEPGKLTLLEKKTLRVVFQLIPVLQETVKDRLSRQEAVAK
jgi:CBS domain-containing protein